MKKEEKKDIKKETKKEEKKVESNSEQKEVKKRKRTIKKEETDVIKRSVEFSLIEVIVIVLITGIAVSVASGILVYNNYDRLNNKVISASDSDLSEFVDNYNKILNNYVEELDKKELIDAAISGMYNYIGDEYTVYMDSDNTSDFLEQLYGEYTGIGVEITNEIDGENNIRVRVNRVFKNSPAEKSGIMPNDIITKVDGVNVVDSTSLAETIKKGEKDTYQITYIRDGVENELTLTRERVLINSVSSEIYDDVGYIKLDTFSATTKDQIKEYLDGFDKNVKSLVIDVRDNTGGYLDTAYDVSDLFVGKGKVIYQMKERGDKITSYKAKTGVYRHFDKIVILINNSSASASEILALALKESANATIVGVNSFGKGTVQETGNLSSGAMVKYTRAYWLSPNGNSINKTGIKPDIEVEDPGLQLEEAIKAAR